MNGIILIDKDEGWTSSDIVAKLRGMLREKHIGHAGTLDPMATGLLTVFVGRATRAAEYAENNTKRYIAGLKLGTVTDTEDMSGTVLSNAPVQCSREQLLSVLDNFRGEIEQVPPMYSAVRFKGQRLYKIARRGEVVERKPRKIKIYNLELLSGEGEDWILDVSCSKGTYIRTLCNDIGAALGCGGCMSSLRRIEAGEYKVESAYTLDEVQKAVDEGTAEKLLMPLDSMFSEYEACKVSAKGEKRLRCGNFAAVKVPDGIYRVYSDESGFLMLGRVESGRLRTVKSFYEVK